VKSIDYEKYLVKLSFDYKEEDKLITHYGSGVVILPTEYSEYLYILTAKHTFEKEVENEDYPDEKTKKLFDDEYIKLNLKIELLRFTCEESRPISELYPSYVDTITKIIQLKDKELDFLIFELCIKDIDIDVCPLSISKNNFDEVVVAGFPSIRDKLPYGYDSNFYRDYEEKTKIHFEIKSKEKLFTSDTDEYNAIKGISGGGVFVEKNNQIYLVGIQIEYERPNSFKCISLQTIYREINSILKSRTDIISIPIDLDNGKSFDIDMVQVKLEDKTLYVGKYPVTYFEYDLYLESEGFSLSSSTYTSIEKENYPVVKISWDKAIDYCQWLSKIIDKEVKLLSSEDWNFIVRNNIFESDLQQYCIFSATKLQPINSVDEDFFGLNDIIGNIYEWCYDGHNNKKYIKGIAFYDSLKNLKEVLEEEQMVRKSTQKEYIGFRIVF